MKTIYTLCLAGLAVAACKSPEPQKSAKLVAETTTESAVKPIKGLEIASRTFTVSATEASTIELPNGGSIEFPEYAFVDAQGNAVKGKVDIHWKEFHSLTDILVSGIPMKYDSLGVSYDFVSGGMFDISATANNQEVNLAQNKKATVNLASIDDTPCYNFYALDEKSGKWDYEATKSGEPMAQQEKPGADKKEKTVSGKPVEEKDFILDVQPNANACPELKSQPIVGWRVLDKVSKQDQRLLASAPSTSVVKPGEKPGEYQMDVDMTKFKRSYRVKPYLVSEAKLVSSKNEVQLEKNYQEILAYQANVNAGKVIRSIEIENFGIYNWDMMHQRESMQHVVADFNLPANVNPALASIFFICPDENIVVKWTANYGSKLYFNPAQKNCIVAILPDNSVMSAGNDEFVRAGKVQDGAQYNFKLQETGVVLESGADVGKYLDKLI